MTITGTVINVLEGVQITSTFKKRELWIETPHATYPQTLSIEFINDKCALLDNIGINDKVDIEIELRGRQSKDKVYNTIAGWKITVANQKAVVRQEPVKKAPVTAQTFTDAADDLPF